MKTARGYTCNTQSVKFFFNTDFHGVSGEKLRASCPDSHIDILIAFCLVIMGLYGYICVLYDVYGVNMADMEKNRLDRTLGLFDATMIVIGIMIGSGIFATTGIMARSLPMGWLILLAWVIGGLVIMCGVLSIAELSAAMPRAGGLYVYLKKAYGEKVGFLFGWMMILVIMPGGISALSMAFTAYFGLCFPALSTQNVLFTLNPPFLGGIGQFQFSAGHLVAMLVVLGFTFFNYIGVVFGKAVQNILTVIKITILLVFIVLGFFASHGQVDSVAPFYSQDEQMNMAGLLVGMGYALVAVFWANEGWTGITYVAGEVKNPTRNLPIALILSVMLVTVIYFLVNQVYLKTLTIAEMQGVVTVAVAAAVSAFGHTGALVLNAVILISIAGALNGTIFTAPRIYYSIAVDGLFFRGLSKVHPRFKTPSNAILIQLIWSLVLILFGSFEQLFTYSVLFSLMFYAASAAAVIVLRKREPKLIRPYKVWGYPITPLVFIAAVLGIIVSVVIKSLVESVIGLFLLFLGLVVYWVRKKKLARQPGGNRVVDICS